MRAKLKVGKIAKPVFNKDKIVSFISEIAEDMQDRTIDNAPEDTSTLKNHGIEKEQIQASIYGEKVFLDTQAVKANYPSEYQRSRPDGGNYPYYQEEGWTQHGITHPGKFYFERAYNITMWESESKVKKASTDAISFK